MLRIGKAAKMYGISPRSLRYWEKMGVLKSIRDKNDHRNYDDENIARIRKIALLRKLRMPIAEIERILIASDFSVAIDALSNHLESLKKDKNAYIASIANDETLIQHIRDARNMEQVFSLLEANYAAELRQNTEPQIQLSERMPIMPKESLGNVRLVILPAMTVAAYRAESATPEDDCSKVFNRFVLENDLHKRDGYRNFGFNNPSPSECSSVYGYEMWVTIPENFNVKEPLTKKKFDGGLYASISSYMNEIGERWQELYKWCKKNDYFDADLSHQWLEECTMDFEIFTSEYVPYSVKQLDLLHPIKKKV